MSMPMNVLLLAHTATSSVFVVGSHHYLRELNRKPETFALHFSSPKYPLSFLRRREPRERDRLDPAIYALFPLGRLRVLDYLSTYLIVWQIRRHLGRSGVRHIDAIIVDQPSMSGSAICLKRLYRSKLIYRPTDIYTEMMGSRIKRYEAEILRSADGLASTSSTVQSHLVNEYGQLPLNTIVIPNGFDAGHFKRSKPAGSSPPRRLVYVGSLDSRFDLESVKRLAEKNQSVQIDLFGPITDDIAHTALPANISLKGAVDYALVPGVLSEYDAALLPMRGGLANEGRSPMKLYEYLACELPVLTRKTSATAAIESENIYFYDDSKRPLFEIIKEVKEFQKENPNIQNQSWASKAAVLLNFIRKL